MSPAFHPGFLPWESVQVPCPQSITGQATDSWSHQLKRRHMLIFVLGYTEICGSLKSMNFSELCTMVLYLWKKSMKVLVQLELTDIHEPVLFSWVHTRIQQP